VLRGTDSDLPLAKSFYVAAGETDTPGEWAAWAEDQKASNPGYSVRDFRADIEQDQQLFTDPSERHAVHFSSASPEWYTPPEIIAAVLDFFDQIDLDPCSNSKDAPNVPAAHHLTTDDDGLHAAWWGRVYVNPPYGREIGPWVQRACNSYLIREIEAAILLVPARTDTEWFRHLRDFPRCFIGGRVRFISPDGEVAGAPFPSALVYLGDEIDRFTRAVSHLGDVFTRYTPREV
jgi:phage N-6-adenine-methyltransferase